MQDSYEVCKRCGIILNCFLALVVIFWNFWLVILGLHLGSREHTYVLRGSFWFMKDAFGMHIGIRGHTASWHVLSELVLFALEPTCLFSPQLPAGIDGRRDRISLNAPKNTTLKAYLFQWIPRPSLWPSDVAQPPRAASKGTWSVWKGFLTVWMNIPVVVMCLEVITLVLFMASLCSAWPTFIL